MEEETACSKARRQIACAHFTVAIAVAQDPYGLDKNSAPRDTDNLPAPNNSQVNQ